MMDEGVQIVFDENVIRNELAGYGDKFRAFEVGAGEEVNDIEVGKSGISAVVVTIGNDRVKKGANGGGISSGCGDNARVIDPVSTDGAADAASDLIVDVVVLLFGLRVVIRYIFEAVSRAITT